MRLIVAAVLLVLSLPAAAVEVVASIRPLALIADAVLAGHGQTRQLVPDGASGHEYALRPSDRARLASASLVLWVGPAHEHFLVAAVKGRPQLVAQSLPGMTLLPARRLADAKPVPGSLDPHLWLEPDNAATIARALAAALATRDPASADAYRRNAETFAGRLEARKAALQQRFLPLKAIPLIAYHDAYHYLDAALGLAFRGSLTHEPEHKPGAKHVLAMAKRVQAEKIACLLMEPGADAALARRVFGAQPYRAVAIDELFTGAARGADGYEAGLSAMADAMAQCLGAP